MKTWPILAMCLAACGASSPTSPSQSALVPQPVAAKLEWTGGLTTQHCDVSGTLWLCDFSGDATNVGVACATNVRGIVATYRNNSTPRSIINTAPFTYPNVVRPGERFTYQGTHVVLGPEDDWFYSTTFTWDNTVCP